MVTKKLISIVIPAYNEEEVLPELVKRLQHFFKTMPAYQFEVIIVENGSTDKSYDFLIRSAKKDKRFKILQLSRNFGADNAIAAGMKFAKGNALVILMADLQEPIDLIKDFIKKWEEGYEIVYGIVKKRVASLLRNFNSILFYKIINFFALNKFPENVSDFRLVDRKVYQVINNMNERNKYLRGMIEWAGFTHIGVPFDRQKRFAGQSKADTLTVLNIALNGIFSFSYLPLRLISLLGILITGVSFIMIIFYLCLYFAIITSGKQVIPGITTLILLILFLFGVLFFVLGIISEYLLRIYDEVKGRPYFIVKNKNNL